MEPEDAAQVVGIAGMGSRGAGIAESVLRAGLDLRLYDASSEALEAAENLSGSVRAGQELEVLGDADIVIEALPEDLALKRGLFARLGELLPSAVLASNTATLPIAALAAATPRPERVVGMHFPNPVSDTELVEVVRGEQASDDAVARVEALARRLERTPVRAADSPGLVVDRLRNALYGEALRLLGERAGDAALVDRAVREVGGFGRGPFEVMDALGVDDTLAVSERLWVASYGEPRFRPHPLHRRLVQAGRLGRKSGRGLYSYE